MLRLEAKKAGQANHRYASSIIRRDFTCIDDDNCHCSCNCPLAEGGDPLVPSVIYSNLPQRQRSQQQTMHCKEYVICPDSIV